MVTIITINDIKKQIFELIMVLFFIDGKMEA